MIPSHNVTVAPLGQLKAAEYNPRAMPEDEMRKLVRSIAEYGFVEPVVARAEDSLLVGGHQRVAALRLYLAEQGMDEVEVATYEVPVVFIEGLTDERTKALNIALNKIHGEWAYDKLAVLLEELAPSGVIELSGYTADEARDLVEMMAMPEGIDAPPEAEIDEGITAQNRKFAFEVPTDEEGEFVRSTLALYGMTGPGNAAQALLDALRAAKEAHA